MTNKQTVGILPAHGTTENERCGIDIEHRGNGETWLIVYAGGRKDDPEAPFTIDAAARLSPDQRAAVIAALRGDVSTDATPGAEHASAIRGALTWLREAIADTDNASELGKTARLIHTHLAALDAARIAAEQRADALMTNRVSSPPSEMAKGDMSVKAGFIDGWGGWVGIAADRYSRMVRVISRDGDGSRHYVCFLPHERKKVLTAFEDAFGDLDVAPAPARAEGGA